jgi:outer membrane protein assembly factor BamB
MTPQKPIRLWPGVVAALVVVLFRFVLPFIDAELILVGLLGGLIGVLAIVIWWLFFSRAPWLERLAVIGFIAVAIVATRVIVHESIRGGMMGLMMYVYSIFVVAPALVAGVAVSRGRSAAFRAVSIGVAILIACGSMTLLRTAGIKGGSAQLAWRWSQTPEERLLAQAQPTPAPVAEKPDVPAPAAPAPGPTTARDVKPAVAPAPSIKKDAEWPGFRGPNRDDVVRGVKIGTDWSASPPVRLWRQPIGPGWSSFAVSGDLLYTQEQRGEDEIVACYHVSTGKPVWTHKDKIRFYESNGGPGPRGTPTLSNGRVYAFGATGRLNVLDAATGSVVWAHDVAKDADKDIPMWGFSSSPLVIGDVVVVAASGNLVAYDAETGKLRWSARKQGGSYSSPHRVTIDGVDQILQLSTVGATSVAPADGRVLWQYAWADAGWVIVQPAILEDGDVLINGIAGMGGIGIRRLGIQHNGTGWTAKERWTSTGLKPYFNDFVVHNRHAYGFDGNILSCIDLEDGARKWKGGRYGDGQLILLADQDLLLVVSEDGELVLVSATPDQFKEVARFQAIEGKTWNHPVLVGDTLLVRNGEEMAAFRLPLAGR